MKETFAQENEFKIDSLLLNEWELYRDLWLDALTNDPQAFAYSLDKMLNRTEDDWKEDMKKSYQDYAGMYIAKIDNEYIGMAGYFPKYENNVNIFGMYVKKKFRGKGIADKMMESILNSLSDNEKIKSISLSVNNKQKEAINFYKRFGFEIMDENENIKMGDGSLCTMLSMKKDIK